MGRGDHYAELTREELYAQVWAEPMTKLAQRYGLSDRGLAKICTRTGIPVPGRGYWARVQSGQVPRQAKLPKIKAGQKAMVNLNKRGHIALAPPGPSSLAIVANKCASISSRFFMGG
jgi:hypothetical protein